MMRSATSLILWSALLASLGPGCVTDSVEDDDEVVAETEQGVYSNWVTIGGCMAARFCRTPTRFNWQFAYNSCSLVTTFGDTFGELSSNLSGIPSGSKYRTHNGATWFAFRFGPGTPGSYHYGRSMASIPDCSWIYNPGW